jgi:hypothetical protein
MSLRSGILGTLLLAGAALAADDFLAQGKKLIVQTVTETDLSGTKTRVELKQVYKITEVTETTIKYDVKVTGKTVLGDMTVEIPASETKDQEFTRPKPEKEPTGPDSKEKLEESEIDVDAGAFKGKVKVIHVKSETAETWASSAPFEVTLKLGEDSVKVHCAYTKAKTKLDDSTTSSEILTLVDFPLAPVFTRITTDGETKIETTSKLVGIK